MNAGDRTRTDVRIFGMKHQLSEVTPSFDSDKVVRPTGSNARRHGAGLCSKRYMINIAITLSIAGILLHATKVFNLPTFNSKPWILSSTKTQNRYSGNAILSAQDAERFQWKCIPPPSPFIFEDEKVVSNEIVQAALEQVQLLLNKNGQVHKDAVSVSIVHASKGKIFEHHSGRNRLNETAADSPKAVDGDSIYRIASISKSFTVLEALVLGRQAQLKGFTPELTLDTRLKSILPEFHLPAGFESEAEEITLAQLGSHLAGLARDVGEFEIDDLNDITYPPPPGLGYLSDFPHNRSEEELVKLTSQTDLIWQVGEMASYSNTGFSMLGIAVEKYHKKLWNDTKVFRDIITKDILQPLNMSHSFLGPIPSGLSTNIVVPAMSNVVDKVFAISHDPAGGIFSSSNDLSLYLHKVLLSRKPELITAGQRRTWLRSIFQFTDGLSSVGIPWETYKAILPDFSNYNVYFKGGGLPGQYTEISVIPEFGYGVVVLTSVGISDSEVHSGGSFSEPFLISNQIHNLVLPAFWSVYNSALVALYAGIYVSGDGFARISFKEGVLVLEQFFTRGVDVLLRYDEIMWNMVGKRERVFKVGAKLSPTALKGEFRTSPLYGCAWGSFDAIKTKHGWGIDKLVLDRDDNDKMTLVYMPMNATLYKVS